MTYIAGVDEVGRGAWAGPLVAAAVILHDPIDGVKDSKQLTSKRRVELDAIIRQLAVAWAIAEISVAQIDDLGLAEANRLAMRTAVYGLKIRPELVRCDGFSCDIDIAEEVIIKGDVTVPEISAASIIAKVHRDRLMAALHLLDGRYAYDQHVGYGTALHAARLQQHGASPHHRQSFAPIKALQNPE